MEYEIVWSDIIDYFGSNSIGESEKEEIIEFLNYEPNWDEVTDYLRSETLSADEQDEILILINHQCDDNDDDEWNSKYNECKHEDLSVLTLLDVEKFEIIRNLYNNCTLDELQGFEKGIKIRII